jgi:2-dehydro-3-deoxygluconokinase
VAPGESDIFAAEDAALRPAIEKLVAEFPNLQTIAATLRRVHTASVNDWGALCYHEGQFYRSRNYPRFDILDRIGAGDSFVAGLVAGLLQEGDAQKAVNYGAAHGALAMTTPGDTSMATLVEVQKLAEGGDSKVQR